MSDRVLTDLGIWTCPWWKRVFLRREPPKLDQDTYEVLVESVKAYLKGGGILTWDLWRQVTTQTRAAFVQASEMITAERAAQIGLASQSALQAAMILQDSDNGDLRCAVALDLIAVELN